MTNCYNYPTTDSKPTPCPYLVVNKNNLEIEVENKLDHDAIGFTHLASYFYNVNYEKILFVHSLTNKAYIYDLQHLKPIDSIGDFQLLNEGIASLPFSTQIIPYSSAKDVVQNVSQFSKTINYLEGGAFLNDTTIFLVEKTKGGIKSKRILHFYTYNQLNSKWQYYSKRSFQNNIISKKYFL